MNMIMVDVSHIPGVSVGDEAVLIGSQGSERISAEELAGLTSTINYEVVTRIQQEIPRVVVDDSFTRPAHSTVVPSGETAP